VSCTSFIFRRPIPADYERVMGVMPGWWNGRDLYRRFFTIARAARRPAVRLELRFDEAEPGAEARP
jgi:hypothetical protein